MYEHADWITCKSCGNTNCLFKLRVDHHLKKRTGNIKYKITRICKPCYQENCRIKNDRQWRLNREKVLLRLKIYRLINREKYNAQHRKYYQRYRLKALENKRIKYHFNKKIRKKTRIERVKLRDSIILHRR